MDEGATRSNQFQMPLFIPFLFIPSNCHCDLSYHGSTSAPPIHLHTDSIDTARYHSTLGESLGFELALALDESVKQSSSLNSTMLQHRDPSKVSCSGEEGAVRYNPPFSPLFCL